MDNDEYLLRLAGCWFRYYFGYTATLSGLSEVLATIQLPKVQFDRPFGYGMHSTKRKAADEWDYFRLSEQQINSIFETTYALLRHQITRHIEAEQARVRQDYYVVSAHQGDWKKIIAQVSKYFGEGKTDFGALADGENEAFCKVEELISALAGAAEDDDLNLKGDAVLSENDTTEAALAPAKRNQILLERNRFLLACCAVEYFCHTGYELIRAYDECRNVSLVSRQFADWKEVFSRRIHPHLFKADKAKLYTRLRQNAKLDR